jgi:voltage-gated sodium channel
MSLTGDRAFQVEMLYITVFSDGIHEKMSVLVEKDWFQWLVALIIILNIASIGLETDATCPDCKADTNLWLGVNSFFAAFYVVEFGLKFYCYSWRCLKGASQLLDFGLVLLAVVDTWILQFVFHSGSVRSLSMLRVLRVVRLSRVLRFMAKQTELRLLIQSFQDLYKYLMPFAVAMLVVIYWYSLVFSALYERGKDDSVYPKTNRWSGADMWGSLPRTMFTFFQVATGDRWAKEIVRPLLRVYPLYGFIFIPYLLLMFFALRAAIVARTSDSVIQSGSVAESRLKAEEKRTHALLGKLSSNFTKETDWLNYEDLSKYIREDANRKILASLSIPVSDLVELFYILDHSGTGKVARDAFFGSIFRISGPAMGRHVTSIEKKAHSLASKAVITMYRLSELESVISRVEDKLLTLAKQEGLKMGNLSKSVKYLITQEPLEDTVSFNASGSSLSLRSKRSKLIRRQRSMNTSFLIDD